MKTELRNRPVVAALAVAVFAAGALHWLGTPADDGSLVQGNGRIEATEVDVAAKSAGRVADILVNEGDFVQQGQAVARMDTKTLESQLAQADAGVAAAEAVVSRLQAELDDGILRAPRGGRVQFRVVQPGEVVGGGGKVVSPIDIVDDEIRAFVQRYRGPAPQPVQIVERALSNPNLSQGWFAGVTAIINDITMLGILLTGAALFRDAGVDVVWPQFLMVAAIGGAFFALAHHRLRHTIGTMQG